MGGRDWYYKASFDKANRTEVTGARGPGFTEGLEIFEGFRREHPNIKLSDCHEITMAILLRLGYLARHAPQTLLGLMGMYLLCETAS